MSRPACTGPGGRGCPCDWHARRRTDHAAHAAAKRDRELTARNQTATMCQRRQGSGVCGGILAIHTDGSGRLVVTCPRCERRRRGICQDCPRPVEGHVGKALRCAEHKAIAIRAAERAYTARNHDEVLARARAAYADDAVRRRRCEYKRAWRKANPEKVRAQKQRYVERHRGDPASRYERYHARYRSKHKTYYRELQRQRNALQPKTTSPRCTKCGRSTRWTPIPGAPGKPWTKCARCCFPNEIKARRAHRRAALKEAAELAQHPVKVRAPKAPAVRGPGFERLCIAPGCDIVVTGRKKKCTKCRARDRELANEQLASSRGRGRRVDLERVA